MGPKEAAHLLLDAVEDFENGENLLVVTKAASSLHGKIKDKNLSRLVYGFRKQKEGISVGDILRASKRAIVATGIASTEGPAVYAMSKLKRNRECIEKTTQSVPDRSEWTSTRGSSRSSTKSTQSAADRQERRSFDPEVSKPLRRSAGGTR